MKNKDKKNKIENRYDKINKFVKLISSDKIDIKEALKTLNQEDKMGGMMRLINEIEERGEKKGIEKGKRELAKRMLLANFDINQISDITGLSVEELGKL